LCFAAGFSWFYMTNQLNRGLDLISQLDSLSVSVNMHEENPRLIPEEVIVQSRDLKAVFKEGGHHRIHFVLSQNQISHHHFTAALAFGHGEPAAKTKGSRKRIHG